jgi:DNA helicase-2/ATP-dependent DNA helicase PcrA
VLEHALFNAALAYRVYGGLRFFERQEVKHALAYLRLIASPDDDGALLRVVNMPARGVGSRSVEALQEAARVRGTSLWQAACSSPPAGRAGGGVAQFVRLIEELRAACLGLSLPETVQLVIDKSGLKAHYEADKDGQERLENLNELVTAAARFDAEGGTLYAEDATGSTMPGQGYVAPPSPLHDFLAHASLEAGENQAAPGEEALQLMTVHSAKGLEFHAVFISGLEEGLFPHENSLNEQDGVEEERRLMYVALTRARQRLYLSHAQTRMLHGQTRYSIASRFLEEIPETLVRRLSARRGSPFAFAAAPASAPTPAQGVPSALAGSPWRIGQSVVHPKFGPGVIVRAEGRGSDARVEVNFRHVGMKWLALEYAKLSPA